METECLSEMSGQWMVPGIVVIVILICHRPLKLILFCLLAGLGEDEESHGWLRAGEDMCTVPEKFNFSGDSARSDACIPLAPPATTTHAPCYPPTPLNYSKTTCMLFHHHILPSCCTCKYHIQVIQ
jgi:hypothetical protein